MGFLRRTHFVRTGSGDYKLRLSKEERDMLASLPDQLEALLVAGGPDSGAEGLGMVRLFPPAYLDDRSLDEEYHRLMRDELVRRRLESLSVVRETVRAERLDDAQLNAWMRVLNDARLILGTVLDVSEDSDVLDVDPESPDLPQRVLYLLLTGLVDEAVSALAGGLPPPSVD
jgi:hypothetical protein